MVQEGIIKKYGLQETNYHNGASFINNEKIYLWPDVMEGVDTYLMGCDFQGVPLTNGMVGFYMRQKEGEVRKWCSGVVPNELLENMEIGQIKKYLQRNLDDV